MNAAGTCRLLSATILSVLLATPLAIGVWGASAIAGTRHSVSPTVRIARNVVYASAGAERLLLDAYVPAQGLRHPGIVFIHGGGWRAGGKAFFAPGEEAFAPAAVRLARLGFVVFSIDYRLEPPARFPAAITDVIHAVGWLRAHAARFRLDPRRIGAFGASAGGNLAAILATLGSGRLDEGARVRVAVSWSGPMDLRSFDTALSGGAAAPFVEGYLGCTPTACPNRYRKASPVSHVDASDAPMLIANGTSEIVPLAQAQEMAAALAAAHTPYRLLIVPGSRHAAQYATKAWGPTIAFFRRYLR